MKNKIPSYKIKENENIVFRLLKIEDIPHNYENKPHRHEFYEILWFSSKNSNIVIDFETYCSEKEAMYFITPGKVNYYDSYNTTGNILVFSKDFISNNSQLLHIMFVDFYNNPKVVLDSGLLYQINHLLELIKFESGQPEKNLKILESYLISLLLNIQKSKKQLDQNKIANSKNTERIINFYQLVETNYRKEHKAEFYADNLYLTSQQTNLILKNTVGKTISRIIHERLVLEAKRQFLLKKMNIKEISYYLGFDDPAYFSRFIKKYTGFSPDVLKTNIRKYSNSTR